MWILINLSIVRPHPKNTYMISFVYILTKNENHSELYIIMEDTGKKSILAKEHTEKRVNECLKIHHLEKPTITVHDILAKGTHEFLRKILKTTTKLVMQRNPELSVPVHIASKPKEDLAAWREEEKQRRDTFEARVELKAKRKREDFEKLDELHAFIQDDLNKKRAVPVEKEKEPEIGYRITERDLRYSLLIHNYTLK